MTIEDPKRTVVDIGCELARRMMGDQETITIPRRTLELILSEAAFHGYELSTKSTMAILEGRS